MNELNRPHFLYYIWDMPKGLHPYPNSQETWRMVRESKRLAEFYGNGKSWCGGPMYLPTDEELYTRLWESQITDYNGGLRIEHVEVKNYADAVSKMPDIEKKAGFVRFCNPERYERN